jgi:YbbR domain-containing protein
LWALRLLALTLAIMAWALISLGQRERFSETELEPQLQFSNIPSDLTLLNQGQEVRVRLRGPVSRMASINPLQVNVVVDLSGLTKGTQEVELRPDYVNRPPSIDVVAIEPSKLPIELDELVTELKPVIPVTAGEPAAGAVVKSIDATPRRIALRGPESILRRIEHLDTRPVLLDGHAIDFEESTFVLSPDPLVEVLQDQVVTVSISLAIPGTGTEESSPSEL